MAKEALEAHEIEAVEDDPDAATSTDDFISAKERKALKAKGGNKAAKAPAKSAQDEEFDVEAAKAYLDENEVSYNANLGKAKLQALYEKTKAELEDEGDDE